MVSRILLCGAFFGMILGGVPTLVLATPNQELPCPEAQVVVSGELLQCATLPEGYRCQFWFRNTIDPTRLPGTLFSKNPKYETSKSINLGLQNNGIGLQLLPSPQARCIYATPDRTVLLNIPNP